jgi:hypothetical protein
LIRDKKRLIRNKLMTKLNLVNLLNPWLEIWYQDNFIETKGKKTKNTNLKKIIKKKTNSFRYCLKSNVRGLKNKILFKEAKFNKNWKKKLKATFVILKRKINHIERIKNNVRGWNMKKA